MAAGVLVEQGQAANQVEVRPVAVQVARDHHLVGQFGAQLDQVACRPGVCRLASAAPLKVVRTWSTKSLEATMINPPANSRHFAYSALKFRLPRGYAVQVLSKATVLSIFWTLRIVGPMSEEGGDGVSRATEPMVPAATTRANKEASRL